jgi:hypothetical protein
VHHQQQQGRRALAHQTNSAASGPAPGSLPQHDHQILAVAPVWLLAAGPGRCGSTFPGPRMVRTRQNLAWQIEQRCIEDSYCYTPRSRQNGAIIQHPDPALSPILPSPVLNSSPPPSSSTTHLGLSQPSALYFYLFEDSIVVVRRRPSESPLAGARSHNYEAAKTSLTQGLAHFQAATRNTTAPGNRRNRSRSHNSVDSVLAPSSPFDPAILSSSPPRKVDPSRLPKQNAQVR